MQEHRALILRGNRFLGSALVDKGMISMGDLEAANEKFMEAVQDPEVTSPSILSTLLFERKALEENTLIHYLVEESDLGLIDLNQVTLKSLRPINVDLSLCWATSTVPFDKVENTYLLATCYYLSAPVVKHWEEALGGRVIWYATTMSSMAQALERIQTIHETEDAQVKEEDD